jgi:hypothetical protein
MLLLPSVCLAAPPLWTTSTDPTFAALEGWSDKVELGDLDGDGDLDVIIPNGGGYSSAGTPEPSVLLLNDGAAAFTPLVLPELVGLHRAAKVRDFDGDGIADVFLAGAWQTPSVLLLGDGAGGFVDASDHLPTDPLSVGDAEPGDVDDDGDLDLVLADSGPGNALFGDGAVTRLWRNDGAGVFTDDSLGSLPNIKIAWSWDLELLDVDGDFDLDLAISCKTCAEQYLYLNDGAGVFSDASTQLPGSNDNYDFEGLDFDGDGALDLVTINDGPQLTERILIGDGAGSFADETADRLPTDGNKNVDDNVAVLLDFDDDGDVDVLVGSLSGDDRLFVNDGTGHFTTLAGIYTGPDSPGTLGMAAGDLNGDGKLDLVDVQGEAAFADYLRIGEGVPADTHPPRILAVEAFADPVDAPFVVRAEVDDRLTPITPDSMAVVVDYTTDAGSGTVPMAHAGHALYRAVLDVGAAGTYQVCATDRAGNQACSDTVPFALAGATTPAETGDTGVPATTPTTGTDGDDTGTPPATDDGGKGCGCGGGSPSSAGLLVVVGLMLARVRLRVRPEVP